MTVELDHAWIKVEGPVASPRVLIGGDLTLGSLPAVQPELMRSIEAADRVTIDLEQLAFCDSVGIGMFIAAQAKAEAYATELALINLQPAVRRLFRVTDLDVRFGLTD